MPNVLLVAYTFPPGGGIGVPRALAYAQHLPRNGCHLSVLAPTEPALRDRDPELGKLIPDSVTVHRAWNPEIPLVWRDRLWKGIAHSRSGSAERPASGPPGVLRRFMQRLLFPDPQVVWTPLATAKACRVVRKQAIDTVIVTVPPFSALKIGVALKRRFPQLRLITDFRDDWVGYYLRQIDHPTEEKIRRAQQLEAAAVAASTYVSTVTEKWVNQFRERYPGQPADKFICTPNGYDPETFRDFTPRERHDGKIVVTYFGTVHNNRVYSPENYLEALENLPEEIRGRIETRFIGRVVSNARQSLERTRTTVRVRGFVPRLEGIRQLQETDFVLLIATDPGSHAGKLFDYLGAGKPILALSPRGGEIDQLLQRTRCGWCADPWDQRAIQEMIVAACQRLMQGGSIIDPDKEAVQAYSWPQILATFAQVTGINRAAASPETAAHAGGGPGTSG